MKWKVEVGPGGVEEAVDRELVKVIGVGHEEYKRAMAVTGPMPMALFNLFVALVDRSGVVEMLMKWDLEGRKSKGGRKALINYRAVLIIELMSAAWTKGAQYQEFAATLAYRLTYEQFQVLGIEWDQVKELTWYHRHWRAKKRLLNLIDPHYLTPKNRRLKVEEAIDALNAADTVRQDRLDWTMQALVDASVSLLPQRYRDAYSGDIAVDSTKLRVLGRIHSKAFSLMRTGKPLDHAEVVAASRSLLRGGYNTNADFTSGTYSRAHHEKPGKGLPENAHELDFVTLMDTAGYDEHPAFARLITAVSIHRPAEITERPRRAVQAHSRTFEQRGIAAVDRAFNQMESQNFQQPLRMDYWEMAFDYKAKQFGQQASVHGTGIIVVDGAFYVEYMSQELIWCTYWYKNGEPNPETGEFYTWRRVQELIEERRAYQLKRHGSLAADARNGAQRFTYPDPGTYKAFDPATNRPLPQSKNTLRGSVRIQPDTEVVRHLQRHPWGTAEWEKVYGQRNQVESTNSDIKRSRFTDIEDPQKRPGKGVAYQGLASALMVVAHNIRVLVRALVEEFNPRKRRARKRRSDSSVPSWTLTAADELDSLEPPDDVAA